MGPNQAPIRHPERSEGSRAIDAGERADGSFTAFRMTGGGDSLWVPYPGACSGLDWICGSVLARDTKQSRASSLPQSRPKSGLLKCPGACSGDLYWKFIRVHP